jgi:hypothetical protein
MNICGRIDGDFYLNQLSLLSFVWLQNSKHKENFDH